MGKDIDFTIKTNIDTSLFILRDAKHEYNPFNSHLGESIGAIDIFPETIVIGGCPRGMYHNQIDFVFGLNPEDDGLDIELETSSGEIILEEMDGMVYLRLPCSERMKISIVGVEPCQHYRIYIGEIS